MKKFSSRIACAGLALLPLAAFGQAQQFTDLPSFLDAAGAGVYSDNFSTIDLYTPTPSYSFSGGSDLSSLPFEGTITSVLSTPGDGNLFNVPNGLSTDTDGYALTYDFTSGNVRAVGGHFGVTDINGNFIPGTLEFSLSDGTSVDVALGSESAFQGFLIADGPTITGLSVFPLGSTEEHPLYAANSQLFVGVPETSTYAGAGFMALCVGGLWLRRARKAA
ncbi:MAG TPA: hypothetical protein VMB21_05230 [Candidatus Limnocylindria bacterium]|nr:hypothetical protein [Candidatus Limnocylindria bacterium]